MSSGQLKRSNRRSEYRIAMDEFRKREAFEKKYPKKWKNDHIDAIMGTEYADELV